MKKEGKERKGRGRRTKEVLKQATYGQREGKYERKTKKKKRIKGMDGRVGQR